MWISIAAAVFAAGMDFHYRTGFPLQESISITGLVFHSEGLRRSAANLL
jgi:hypothetical protein